MDASLPVERNDGYRRLTGRGAGNQPDPAQPGSASCRILSTSSAFTERGPVSRRFL